MGPWAVRMTMAVSQRHWRSYGTGPLRTGQDALREPFHAFPSWFLRVECDRCGKAQKVHQGAHEAGRYAGPQHPRRPPGKG